MNHYNKKSRILIVGAGPTGMTLACHLIKQGIPCRIIDKRADLTKESKAININSASMHMFDRMGIADRFMAKGREIEHVFIHWNNKRIVHVDYSRIEAPYHFFLSMPQAKSERVISDYLTEIGGVVERKVEFLSSKVEHDFVEVTMKHPNGEIETEQFDYLMACDGARSDIRNHLEIPFKGIDYNMYYHLFDGHVECSTPVVDTHYFVTEKGYFIIAPMVDGYYRMVLFDETQGNKTCTHEELQELIDLYGPGYVKLKEVLWQSKGFFYNRLLEDFRHKQRVFFAGDSAHIFSPLGGHGMNTALHDTDNLAWKLAGVINHGWDDRILDTYTEERKETARVLIKNTDFSTRLINKTERELIPNLENWLPLMKNRGVMRKRTAYQFSGLAQKFLPSDFIQATKNIGSEKSIIGKYLPYSGNLKCDGEAINTYRLSRDIPVLLVFGECGPEIKASVRDFDFHIFSIVREGSQKDPSSTCTTVVDLNDDLLNRCNVEQGDILLLRPDGVVGFYGDRSSLEKLTRFLDSWFVRKEALVC